MMPNSHQLHLAMAATRSDELDRAAARHYDLDRPEPNVPQRSPGRVRRGLARLSLAPLRQA